MFKFNKKLEYALIALGHMYRKNPGELSSAKEIHNIYQIPFDATSRVMQIMAQKQLLKSEQGAQGGYLIQKDLSKLSFFEFSEIILGELNMVSCLYDQHENSCEIKDCCNIISPLMWLNEKTKDFYRALSMKDLLEKSGESIDQVQFAV